VSITDLGNPLSTDKTSIVTLSLYFVGIPKCLIRSFNAPKESTGKLDTQDKQLTLQESGISPYSGEN